MECKYCHKQIVDEFESHIVRPFLKDARDPSSETLVEYAHLDCYIKTMLEFIGYPTEDRKLKWWIENP